MTDHLVTTLDQLLEAYPTRPAGASLAKEADRLTPAYAELIGASPFCVVSTTHEGSIDCSPRGDEPGFVRVRDEHTLEMADRRGNNRIDTLRNLLVDPRIGLIFLIPGVGECIRVRGTAEISVDPELLAAHAVKGKQPAAVLVIHVERVFFQCSRAILRSHLWDPAAQVDRASLPKPGQIVAELDGFTAEEGRAYDEALPGRLAASLY
ncbi:pyridoxamine 5'-phosphate oxidase family protein [Mariniluteicoccus endophyticus]